MILKNFNYFLSILLINSLVSSVYAEDKIDIWNTKKNKEINQTKIKELPEKNDQLNLKAAEKILPTQDIKIEDSLTLEEEEKKVFGIYDPSDFNFNLNMWSSTNAEDIKSSIKRLNKLKLSKTSNEILENILLSYSYPPSGMSEKEFVKIKIDWLIKNNRADLIENFLKMNKEFHGKSRAVQYLVDQSISKANIKKGCEKIEFIDSQIKDSYLEKFKIYCLVFNNKKAQAQLLLDLLREQKQSDSFFDSKINYLLGISEKTSNKINDKNLLNFYLSSITIKDFKYEPSDKTRKEIWKYLNAANLIKLEDITNKTKIRELEIASNEGSVNKNLIFNIYTQVPFNLNNLINAKNIYQSLESVDARSLIYQKYLLSESLETKLEYLFILEDLFKKDKIQNIYSEFLSETLTNIGLENLPENYQEVARSKIIKQEQRELGKVKYNDKILHQSKIMKFYLEEENEKKIQKDLNKILKRINKNRKYFFSAKDLALIDSLVKDGFNIPSNLNYKDLSQKYVIPKNLVQLIEKEQNAFLVLKIVEIIGEDEPNQLDPETIYFVTNLLNQMDLVKIRNKVLISALPLRI